MSFSKVKTSSRSTSKTSHIQSQNLFIATSSQKSSNVIEEQLKSTNISLIDELNNISSLQKNQTNVSQSQCPQPQIPSTDNLQSNKVNGQGGRFTNQTADYEQSEINQTQMTNLTLAIQDNLAKSRRSKETISQKREIIRRMNHKILSLEKMSASKKADIFELENIKIDLLDDFLEYEESKRKHQESINQTINPLEDRQFFFMRKGSRSGENCSEYYKHFDSVSRKSEASQGTPLCFRIQRQVEIGLCNESMRGKNEEPELLSVQSNKKLVACAIKTSTQSEQPCLRDYKSSTGVAPLNFISKDRPMMGAQQASETNEQPFRQQSSQRYEYEQITSLNYSQSDIVGDHERRIRQSVKHQGSYVEDLLLFNDCVLERNFSGENAELYSSQSINSIGKQEKDQVQSSREEKFFPICVGSDSFEEEDLTLQIHQEDPLCIDSKRSFTDRTMENLKQTNELKTSREIQNLNCQAQTEPKDRQKDASRLKILEEEIKRLNQQLKQAQKLLLNQYELNETLNHKVIHLSEELLKSQDQLSKQRSRNAQPNSAKQDFMNEEDPIIKKLMEEISCLTNHLDEKQQQLGIALGNLQLIEEQQSELKKKHCSELDLMEKREGELKQEIEYLKSRIDQEGLKFDMVEVEIIQDAIEDREKEHQRDISKLKSLYEGEIEELRSMINSVIEEQEKSECKGEVDFRREQECRQNTKIMDFTRNQILKQKFQHSWASLVSGSTQIINLYDLQLENRDSEIIELKAILQKEVLSNQKQQKDLKKEVSNLKESISVHLHEQFLKDQKLTQDGYEKDVQIEMLRWKNQSLSSSLCRERKYQQDMTKRLLLLEAQISEAEDMTWDQSESTQNNILAGCFTQSNSYATARSRMTNPSRQLSQKAQISKPKLQSDSKVHGVSQQKFEQFELIQQLVSALEQEREKIKSLRQHIDEIQSQSPSSSHKIERLTKYCPGEDRRRIAECSNILKE